MFESTDRTRLEPEKVPDVNVGGSTVLNSVFVPNLTDWRFPLALGHVKEKSFSEIFPLVAVLGFCMVICIVFPTI